MKVFLFLSAIVIFVVSATNKCVGQLENNDTDNLRPNIILILADDLGLGDVKTYGGSRCNVETPNMDRLARMGMKFTDAHSSSSVCTPTRYSILTGRYNWRSRLKRGVLDGDDPPLIQSVRPTIASFLKEHGYATACIGKWHLGMDFPTTNDLPPNADFKELEDFKKDCNIDWHGAIKNGPITRGFDYYWGISASLGHPPNIWIENDRFIGECTTIKMIGRLGPAHAEFEQEEVLSTITRKANEYVSAQARSSKPFFLFFSLTSPHVPIVPSKEFQGKSNIGPYGDFVMETDWAIGEVIRAVEVSGIAENTLFIVTSDNGCSPAVHKNDNSHGIVFRTGEADPFDPKAHYASDIYRGHKADIYEGGHRVPFIVRYDNKVKPGSICSDTICLVDFFASFADILNVDIPGNAAEDSISLLPSFLGNPTNPAREAVVHHSIDGSFAIRQGKWKLIFCPGSGGWSSPTRAELRNQDTKQWVQLYDLSNDSAETQNLASEYPEIVIKLTHLMQAFIDNGRSTKGIPQQNDGETYLYPDWIRQARQR